MASAVRQSAIAYQVYNSVQDTCLAGQHCSCLYSSPFDGCAPWTRVKALLKHGFRPPPSSISVYFHQASCRPSAAATKLLLCTSCDASCFIFPLALGSASPAAVIIELGSPAAFDIAHAPQLSLPAAFEIALAPQLSLPARLSSAQSLQYHLPLSCVPGLMPTHTCAQKVATASASCVMSNNCFTGSQHPLRGRPRWQPLTILGTC